MRNYIFNCYELFLGQRKNFVTKKRETKIKLTIY